MWERSYLFLSLNVLSVSNDACLAKVVPMHLVKWVFQHPFAKYQHLFANLHSTCILCLAWRRDCEDWPSVISPSLWRINLDCYANMPGCCWFFAWRSLRTLSSKGSRKQAPYLVWGSNSLKPLLSEVWNPWHPKCTRDGCVCQDPTSLTKEICSFWSSRSEHWPFCKANIPCFVCNLACWQLIYYKSKVFREVDVNFVWKVPHV